MNKRIALLVGAFVAIIAILAVFYFLTSKKSPKIDRFTELEPRVTLKLFHASWCPHCVDYLKPKDGSAPVWTDKLPAALTKEKVEGVKLEEYEFEANKELADKYKVNSFPTIIGENPRGTVKKFEGNRDSVEDLIKFAKELM